MNVVRYRLALGVLWIAASAGGAVANEPPPAPDAPREGADVATAGEAAPDGDFIEFLGADDVGDAAWWEFLKKSAPRKDAGPEAPQDAKP